MEIYYITVDGAIITSIGRAPKEVPLGAMEITKEQFSTVHAHPMGFGAFIYANGTLMEAAQEAPASPTSPLPLLDLSETAEVLKGVVIELIERVPLQARGDKMAALYKRLTGQ